MAASHTQCLSPLRALDAAVRALRTSAATAVSQALAARDGCPDVAPKSVASLLREDLANETRLVAQAQTQLERAKSLSLWRRYSAVRQAQRNLDGAQQALDEVTRRQSTPEAIEARLREVQRLIDLHQRYVDLSTAYSKALMIRIEIDDACKQIAASCQPLIDAIALRAWVDTDAPARLADAVTKMHSGDLAAAAAAIKAIVFQRPPSKATLATWKTERYAMIAKMEATRAGFAAGAAFPGLIAPTLDLIAPRCAPGVWEAAVESLHSPPDRWHALTRCIADPAAIAEPIQWTVYWAFLSESQLFTEDLTQAAGNEDVLTGELMGIVKKQLREWATPRLNELGYPNACAHLAMIRPAGTKAEVLTGADVGIIVNLHVGDLRVHKVALLQGKVSERGTANIGSKPSGPEQLTQLQKLRDVERDFFLFYHVPVDGSPANLPSVTSVDHYVRKHGLSAASLTRASITVRTKDHGWDLASFMAFGLCAPGTGIGRDVSADQDPLEALLEGGRATLPAYVVVVSMSEDEHGYKHILTLAKERAPHTKARQMQTPTRQNGELSL